MKKAQSVRPTQKLSEWNRYYQNIKPYQKINKLSDKLKNHYSIVRIHLNKITVEITEALR